MNHETPAAIEPLTLEDPDMSLFLTADARLLRYRAGTRQRPQAERVNNQDDDVELDAA